MTLFARGVGTDVGGFRDGVGAVVGGFGDGGGASTEVGSWRRMAVYKKTSSVRNRPSVVGSGLGFPKH